MIIDSHCHAWTRWPYQPPVPDDTQRARVEQLLHEMSINDVDQAAIVCAQIDHNPDNNAYVAEEVARYPDKLHQIADVDCSWSDTYHTSGAADRLRDAATRWSLKGFTHYLRHNDDAAWLYSEDGVAFFQTAVELNLIASIAGAPHHQPAIRKVAERFPALPILCHHLAGVKVGNENGLKEVLASATLPNIYIKLSGFYYATIGERWEYPYVDTHDIVRAEYEHFGPRRMCWGSDFPVIRTWLTYRQSIEAFRTHCDFVPEDDQAWILGKNLGALLEKAGKGAA
ncbi:amidohydrolase [Chloroflexi bacterium TSY]|nr:amidohydrolase [Chloroflexi bacterium TSY]